MKTIWKYPLLIKDTQSIRVPKGAERLHTGVDAQGRLCLWFLIDPDAPYETRTFAIQGTGNPYTLTHGIHVGSVLMPTKYVWHVFEVDA